MESKTVSLTEQIYGELVDGLKTGMDWTQFLAQHGASKGPLYNAIGRFFSDMEPRVRALGEVQAKLDQAGLELDSLDQKIKEAESSLAPLEETKNALNEGIETLETKLTEKSEVIKQVADLEKLGLDIERLRQLREALTEIGAKYGLKGKETVTKFFSDLVDYDAKTGFEREVQRLATITDTKKLEAENWQAKEETLRTKHDNLKEAIGAVDALLKRGIKVEQIIAWNGITSKLGGPEDLQAKLGQYRSMAELLDAKKSKIKDSDKKVTELSAQIKALNEQKVEIEGAIKSLSTSGMKEITKVSDKAMAVLKSLSNGGSKEITKVSDKAVAGLKPLLTEIRVETKRLTALKAEVGKLEKELRYARFFTTSDQAVLKAFPKELVLAFLERVAVYCKLNGLNPGVKMPNGLSRKSPLISSANEVPLLEIIAWAEAGLAGVSQ